MQYQNLSLEYSTSLSHIQHLMCQPNMQQALKILQMPALELEHLIKTHLEENIVVLVGDEKEDYEKEWIDLPEEKELNFEDQDYQILKSLNDDLYEETFEEIKVKPLSVELLSDTFISLADFLMQQARGKWEDEASLKIAEELILRLDTQGFLKNSLDDISKDCDIPKEELENVLTVIQTFEPIGIAVFSLRESLLNQLKEKESFAYQIIDTHYDDFLHGRFSHIKKTLKCSDKELKEAIYTLSHLNLHPGSAYTRHLVQPIIPDIFLQEDNDQLKVRVNDDFIPLVKLNPHYVNMLQDSHTDSATKSYISKKIKALKWLFQNIEQRKVTLDKITTQLAAKNREFFLEPKGELQALTLKQVAKTLKVHESTIARAIANKYLCSSKGTFSLRSFFSYGYQKKDKTIAANCVMEKLQELIKKENKESPYSDTELSQLLKKEGIACARRTIAKYRKTLNVGNQKQRKW